MPSCPARLISLTALLAIMHLLTTSACAAEPPTNALVDDATPRLPYLSDAADGGSGSSGSASGAKETSASDLAKIAGWDDGFYLRSPDKHYVLRITGQIQADYRGFLQKGDKTDIDQFFLRRARFGLEATLFENFEFRFLPDYGQGQDRLQDAYMNVHYWDALQFEAGKFKQPFSYEQLIQDRFVPSMGAWIIDQLRRAR